MTFSTNFENLVTGKTITENQASKIKTIINKDVPSKKSNFQNAITMTNPPKLYVESKLNHINSLTADVANGTITQRQADEIIMKQIYLYHIRYRSNLNS